MRFNVHAVAAVALVSCCAAVVSIGQKAKSASQPSAQKGPLTSQENLPWPAAVVENQPHDPPVLSPADELKTFHMAPGYKLQLVASEPLVKDPILMDFDGDGRMWVMEYTGWALGEKMVNSMDPVYDLVILEDTDHDGVYDKRTVFLDKMVLPRAFKILDHNCALVGEPPHLWKACDTNGDLKADTKELINDTFGTLGIVEHGANGLYWGMDNTIYVAEHTWDLLPKAGGKFETTPTLNRGQWGITQDDGGRIYRNVNTDPLFTDYVAPKYYVRNPDVTRTRGLYETLISQDDSTVWPVHPTLGVNRGYRPEVSRKDGSSYYYQGVSAPLINRGDQLPKNVYGQAFVVDGPTNLVHLLNLKDTNGTIAASDAYKKGEFLASTDERFRPVSLAPGWDGSFYVVDMYRGVSQDEPLQTDYLRNYVGEHKLWEGVHYGRIYRVVADTTKSDPKPHMIEESAAQLVPHLTSTNGWTRDTAQQLLVQRNDPSTVPALKNLATTSTDTRTRLQAMWTLDGMGVLDPQMVLKALNDKSADIRSSALRWSEHWLGDANSPVKTAVLQKIDDPNLQVRHQLAATLGQLPQDQRVAPIVAMLRKYGGDEITVDAAVTSLPGQEVDALSQLIAQPSPNVDAVTMLAGATGKSRSIPATQKVLALSIDQKQPEPIRLALLKGIGTGLEGRDTRTTSQNVAGGKAGGGINGAAPRRRGPVAPGLDLGAEPTQLVAVAKGKGDMATAASAVLTRVSWPGKPAPAVTTAARTPDEDTLYAKGQQIYATNCQACHQAEGQGAPHLGAALAGSHFVNADPQQSVRILTNGKDGTIGEMPPLGASLTDEQLAAVLTYIRGSWGNTGAPIHTVEANEYREMNAFHKKPWTNAELDAAAPKRGGGAN